MRTYSACFLVVLSACGGDTSPAAPTSPPAPPPAVVSTFVVPFAVGSSGSDYGKALTTDAAGNVYAAGYFNGTVDFDPGVGSVTRSASGISDLYLAKYDANGSFVWVTTMGGPGAEMPYNVTVDAAGNSYLAGYLSAGATCGSTSLLANAGRRDAFVAKFDVAGSCIWAVTAGGAEDDEARGFAVDAAGNVYMAGMFQGTGDFDPGTGTRMLSSAGAEDIFLAKYTSAGALVWGHALGGTGTDEAMALAIDAGGNVYLGGFFSGTVDFDPGVSTRSLVSAGGGDIALAKFDASGHLQWADAMGGPQLDLINIGEVVVDQQGSVTISGQMRATVDLDPGPAIQSVTSAGSSDVFVARYAQSDGRYLSAFRFGGVGMDGSHALRVDAAGNVYVAGWITGRVDLDPGSGERILVGTSTGGGTDVFVAKFTSSGTLAWASAVLSNASGAAAFGMATGVGIGANASVWITGRFYGTADFSAGARTAMAISAGESDAFVARFDGAGVLVPR
jgi:hypothetical protein